MIDRLVNKKEKLKEEDHKIMEPSILELYNTIQESHKKIRNYLVKDFFQFENSSEFNFENFSERIKLAVYVMLEREGKMQRLEQHRMSKKERRKMEIERHQAKLAAQEQESQNNNMT